MPQSIQVIIPFKCRGAKSRLSAVLSPEERGLFAFAMLNDVLDTVSSFGKTIILSPQYINSQELGKHEENVVNMGNVGDAANVVNAANVSSLMTELDLNNALNWHIMQEARRGWPSDILIVMADLALLIEKDVAGILNCQGDAVLCPGRGGGTNMILIRNPIFRTCYHGLSFPAHLAYARQASLDVSVFESFRAGCDIDEPQDLAEVLLHNKGKAKRALEEMGFSLSDKGRSLLERSSDS